MLKKLRLKFIALNMGTIAVVLVAAFTAIVVINWQQSVATVSATMQTAIERAAQANSGFGGMMEEYALEDGLSGIAPGDSAEEDSNKDSGETSNGSTPPEIGGELNRQSFIPVAVYRVEKDGSLTALSMVTTASISEDVLEQARTVLDGAAEGSSTIDSLGLRYVKAVVDGTTYLAFTDISSTSSWQTLALTLTGIGIVVLLIFLAISVLFSRWALRPVENAWNSQRQFVADASHELKTPLTVILANSSILMENPNATVGSQSQWIEGTQAEAQRMKGLVDDMLELARLDAETPYSHELVDFAKLTEGCLLQFESLAYERGVSLDSSIAENINVMGNSSRLLQLVGTLIDNGSKYAGHGGNVFVLLEREGSSARLSVTNDGDVIPAESLPHVFDRFWRADEARDRSASGESSYGLGLAIAQGIVQEHNGDITVTSSTEAGTTFTVKLPLA